MLAKVKTLDQYAEIARMAADRAERHGPLDAELPAEATGQWFVLTTIPAHERIAAGHLLARRFGIYLPEFTNETIIRGRLRKTTRTMFPGYLFVFVWDISRHWRRILACTGVQSVMAPVSDQDIDQIRGEENKLNPEYALQQVIKYRKRRKKRTEIIVEQMVPITKGDIVSVRAKSYWSNIGTLEPAQRISKLHAALGLAS